MNNQLRCLAVILFHDEDDMVESQISHWEKNNHEIVVFVHRPSDAVRDLIEKNKHRIIVLHNVKTNFTIAHKKFFLHISDTIRRLYSKKYDWISFVEADEIFEGPNRKKSFYEHLLDVHKTRATHIMYDEFIFWFTNKDDPNVFEAVDRCHYYAHRYEGPRIYTWRKGSTDRFHNLIINRKKPGGYPVHFRSRHYEMRSPEHCRRKLTTRYNMVKNVRGNTHTKVMMKKGPENLVVPLNKMHYDDGQHELIKDTRYDWADIWNIQTNVDYYKI